MTERDSKGWRIGSASDLAWIREATEPGLTIVAAIPAVFERYATVVIPPGPAVERSDAELVEILCAETTAQPWWLGYLDTGAADVVFPDAQRVALYTGWDYVLVEAGPEQARSFRRRTADYGPSPLPDLMFPADRSWLVSKLWDDDWRCIGGPAPLVEALLGNEDLHARSVELGEDATPPGYTAR